MRATLIINLKLEVHSGVIWADTTFALARNGGNQAALFFRSQMVAAAVVVETGGMLWIFLHTVPLGKAGHLFAIGALGAFLAAGVQGAMVAPALRKLSALGEVEGSRWRYRVASGQRIAAALLAITVTCMAAARYA